jgi:hypothetical protein
MTAWNYPIIIVPALLLAISIGFWIIRLAQRKPSTPPFECKLCGLKDRALSAKQWRYCPNCGAPRNASLLKEIPKRSKPLPEFIDEP